MRGACGELILTNPRYRPRPLPGAPLVVRRRYLAVVPRPMPAAPRRYLIVVPRPMPAAPHRYFVVVSRPFIAVPKPLPTAPLGVHHGHVIMVLMQLPAALSQQEKESLEDLQRSKVNITCFICTVARLPSRRCTVHFCKTKCMVSWYHLNLWTHIQTKS
jgi:hypothetical protein